MSYNLVSAVSRYLTPEVVANIASASSLDGSGTQSAVKAAGEAGLRAETTYTGKAWAHVFSGSLKSRKVLFWNTFGG